MYVSLLCVSLQLQLAPVLEAAILVTVGSHRLPGISLMSQPVSAVPSYIVAVVETVTTL